MNAKNSNATGANPQERKPVSLAPLNTAGPSRSFHDYVLVIRERWLIGLITALIVSSTLVFLQFQQVPLYRASTIVLFELQQNRVVSYQAPQDNSIGRAPEYILRNHMTDLRSSSFRREVIDSLSSDERDLILMDYRDPKTGEEPNIHAIVAGANNIHQLSGHVFGIEFHHRNPEAAALLANRYAVVFSEFLLERSRNSNEAAIRFLRSQSEELRLKVEQGELAVQQYRQDRNLVSLEENQNLILERLKSISASLNGERLTLLSLQTQVEQVNAALAAGESAYKLPAISRIESIATRINEKSRLESARASLSLRYGRRHPRMIENATALESIERELREATELAVSDLRKRFEDQKEKVTNLENALKAAEQEALHLDQIAIEYNVLRRKLASDRELFSQILQRLNETVIASQLADTSMRIVDRAGVPSTPFTPDRKKIITMGAFAFILCFIGLPILLDFLSSRLKTSSDVEHYIQKPYLGEIHKFRRRKGMQLARVVLNQEPKMLAELFRILYSQIILSVPREFPQVFVITSAVPREGKSFISANLAASFSRHHHRTLLIDCDLRRPSLHKTLGVDNSVGLMTWYESRKSFDELSLSELGVYYIDEDLDFLPAGGATQEATELIRSTRFATLIEHLKGLYDVIIIDTSPAGVFPEAACLGEYADHYVFVARHKAHNRAKIKQIIRRLDQARANVVGVVFNHTESRKSEFYGSKYYDYKYYAYYSSDEEDRSKSSATKGESTKGEQAPDKAALT